MAVIKKTNSDKIVLLIGRDNWQMDDSLNHILLKNFKKNNLKIIWEDPAGKLIYKLRRIENKINWLPNICKRINLRFTQILFGIFKWDYFIYLKNQKNHSIELRSEKLKKAILKLGENKEIIILSRSSGGRISSLIADELNIKHLICISYPFKNPEMEIEPSRYLHLEKLQTNTLIIQGVNDEYGGIEITEKYIFSPKIKLLFVEGDHEFKINDLDWEKVLNKINEIIN